MAISDDYNPTVPFKIAFVKRWSNMSCVGLVLYDRSALDEVSDDNSFEPPIFPF